MSSREKQFYGLTKEIVGKAVSKEAQVSEDAVEIESFELSDGSNPGENFACVLKSVRVRCRIGDQGEWAEKCYMAKLFPLSQGQETWLRESLVFKTECDFYTKFLPRMENTLLQGGQLLKLPKCLFQDHENGVMIMTNLKLEGFSLIEKPAEFSVAHIKLLLDQLALFHASSHRVLTGAEGLEQFKREFPTMNCQTWQPMTGSKMDGVMQQLIVDVYGIVKDIVTEHYSENHPRLIEKLDAFVPGALRDRIDSALAVGDEDETTSFVCLIHNDVWRNNIMYTHDEAGQPTDVRLVDLQLTRRARPALELGYFFGTCTSPEFQAEHLDDLLEFYHCRLAHFYAATRGSGAADTSIPLPYTLDSLKKDFKDCFAHGHAVGAFHILLNNTPTSYPDQLNLEGLATSPAERAALMGRYRAAQMRQARDVGHIRESLRKHLSQALEWGLFEREPLTAR